MTSHQIWASPSWWDPARTVGEQNPAVAARRVLSQHPAAARHRGQRAKGCPTNSAPDGLEETAHPTWWAPASSDVQLTGHFSSLPCSDDGEGDKRDPFRSQFSTYIWAQSGSHLARLDFSCWFQKEKVCALSFTFEDKKILCSPLETEVHLLKQRARTGTAPSS